MMFATAWLWAGCASDNATSQSQAAIQKKSKIPEVGMTKDQVIALYGKTDNVRVGSNGETWVYNLNVGKVFIPWNLGYHPEMRIVEFDQSGKVKSWSSSP